MDGKCPNCGHELVLFEEWQEDVTVCPACRSSSATRNVRTTRQYTAPLWRMFVMDYRHKPGTEAQTPGKLLRETSPRRKLRTRALLALAALGAAANIAHVLWRIVEHAQRESWRAMAVLLGASLVVATVIASIVHMQLRRRAVAAADKAVRQPSAIAADDVTGLLMRPLIRMDRARSAEALIAVAPMITEEVARELDLRALRGLAERLLLDHIRPDTVNWDLVVAACRVLGKTRWGQALWPLGRLAANGIDGWTVPDNVRAEAASAAEHVRERILAAAMGDSLLRASAPSEDTAGLLRTATPGDVPAEQLLRRPDIDEG